MKMLLTILLIVVSLSAMAGVHYTYGTHSGSISINGATAFGSPVTNGDTVAVTGSFSTYPGLTRFFGGIGDSVVIDFRGATFGTASYVAMNWSDMNYVKVIGLKSTNMFGSIVWTDSIYNIRYTGSKATNAFGSYQNGQYYIQIGTVSNAAMRYVHNSNDIAKTFHGIRFDTDTLNGFQNAPCIANINDGAYNLMEDLEIDHLYVRNLTNTIALSPGVFGGTALGFNIHDNDLDSFQANTGASQSVHAEWFYINGYGEFAYNKGKNAFGSMIRVYPALYSGMTGRGSGTVYIHDNFGSYNTSYPQFEANDQLPANLATLGFSNSSIVTNCVFNTFYISKIYTYNPAHPTTLPHDFPFSGAIMAVFTTNVHVYNNLGVSLMNDTSFTTLQNQMAVSTMTRTGTDTAGNRFYRYALQAGLDSATGATLLSTSPVRALVANKTPYPTTSYNGVTRPAYPSGDVGAYQYVFAGSPPGCTTNLLPVNLTTVTGATTVTLTINASAGATFYDWFLYTGGTPPGTPTFNTSGTTAIRTGLIDGAVYHFYARPGNANGSASGCATSNTQFTTTPLISIITLQRK